MGKDSPLLLCGIILDLAMQPKVPWCKLIQSAPSIPKHNLISWMVILNKLPSKDRLMSWGMSVDPLCLLCQHKEESVWHLFLKRDYSMVILSDILHLCNLQLDASFDLVWLMQHCIGKKLSASILRFALKAFIYLTWREKNRIVHGSAHLPYNEIFYSVCNIVSLRFSSLKKHRPNSAVSRLYSNWKIV